MSTAFAYLPAQAMTSEVCPTPAPCVVPTAYLDRLPGSVPAARRLVRGALRQWDLEGLLDKAELLVSEVVTNAVAHAAGDLVVVSVQRLEVGTVRLRVQDESGAEPTVRQAHDDDEGGRGILLVGVLASAWGVERHRTGKTVWVDVSLD